MSNPAVFFDRDGVLIHTHVRNGKPYAISTVQELQIYADALPLILQFKQLGYKIVIVTNQPDVGNGYTLQTEVEKMHETLLAALPVDSIQVCYHRQVDGCTCRKPAIGMLTAAANELAIDLTRSIMVGDRNSDIHAGITAGCFTILLDCEYNEPLTVEPNLKVKSLSEISHHLTHIRELTRHDYSQSKQS